MEVESFVVGKLFPFEESDIISLHVFLSRIYISKISLDKQIFFYCLEDKESSVNKFRLIWHSSKLFSDSVIVTNEGCMFIRTIKNDLCLFNIKDNSVEIDSEIPFLQFKELLDPVEFGSCDLKVNLITCVQRLMIICLNNQWLITIEWLAFKEPCIAFCLKVEGVINSYVANKDYIFLMTVEGVLFTYKIADGILLQNVEIWSLLPQRELYQLIGASTEPNSLIAILDPSRCVYIFDLSSYINSSNNLKFDDSQSVCSASSGVSYKTSSSYSSISRTSSVASSAVVSKHMSLKYSAADDLWVSYIEKLKKKQSHQGSAEKRMSDSVIKLEADCEDDHVCEVKFTDVGISVWTRPASSTFGGFYRLYEKENGQLIFSTGIPRCGRVLSLQAPTVTMNLFILKDSLCLPLCSIPKHAFINKMLQCIDSKYIKMLLEGWEDMLNPSNLLRSALSDGQLDTVHVALNLHSQLFSFEIVGEGLEGARTKDILDALSDVVKNLTATEQFIRQIKGLQLTHSYRLLGILDEVNIPSFMQSEVAVLRNQVMESIVAARAGLESGVEGSAPAPPEHSVEWVLWEGMSDMDVVRVGVTRLSAVQCFLAVRRGWTPEELSGPKFKEVVLSSVLHLLEKRDIEGASFLISQTGFNVEEELKKICLNSLNKNLIDFIMESLRELWNERELEAWHFLTLVTEVINRNKQNLMEKHRSEDIQLSLNSILSINNGKRQEIITELYFRTWDETLIEKLQPEFCWKFLIESNCIEGIQVWLAMKQPPFSHPWPVNLFSQWPVTQQMIDSVNDFDCAESSKQIIFNCLCLKGLFSSECKRYPQKILRRLAETKSLMCAENILTEDLSQNFLSFVRDYNLIEFTVFMHQQIPSILSLNSCQNQRHEVKWLDLWQSFINTADTWNETNILNSIQRAIDYLVVENRDSYLMDHPLIVLALALIQDESLLSVNNDLLSVSPLLAVCLPSNNSNDRRETTLYSLLSGTSAFQTDALFLWQKDHSKTLQKGREHSFPHFSCEKLSMLYGHKQSLNYIDQLKQARPSFALVQFFHEFSNAQGNTPTRMQKRGANIAHGLALQLFKDKDVGSSCVAFTEMLSIDSTPLRIHLACVDAISDVQLESGTNEIRTILHGIVMNNQKSAEDLLKLLQEALLPQLISMCGQNNVACLRLWQLPVIFANLHQLPLPESFLLFVVENNNWQLFITIVCLFHYPKSQVIQLVKSFKSVALQEHFNYVLQLKVDGQGHINSSGGSPRLIKNIEDSKSLFTSVAEYGNSPEQLLIQARVLRCPGFALLATCFESKYLVACFSEWLAASIPKGYDSFLPSNPDEWGSENVILLLEQVVSLSYIRTLHHAFFIFLPMNPLFLFTKFLINTVEDKMYSEDGFDFEKFSTALSLLPDDDVNFISSKKWILNSIIRLCFVALMKCFQSYFQQNQFICSICCTQLQTVFPVGSPDFELLLSLAECLENYGLTLDFALICADHQNFNYNQQLEKLIFDHKFDVAHHFATVAGLPHDLILVVEWKEKTKSKGIYDRKFWEMCDAAFISGGLSADDAVSFYLEEADIYKSVNERCILLKYALKWIQSKPSSVTTNHEELSVLHSIYECYIQESFSIELPVEDLNFQPLKCFRKFVVSEDTLEWFIRKSISSLTPSQIDKLDSVIGKLFTVGNVSTVWCLEALFSYKNKDSLILDACLGLAEGEFSPDNLPDNISQLLSECSSNSGICHSDFFSTSSRMSQNMLSSCSLNEESFETVDTEENLEREDVLKVVNLLVANADCSSRLVKFIQSALRIGKKFNLQYKEVIEMQNPLVLIEKGCEDLKIAKDVIVLANLPSDQTVFYLCSQIVKAISRSEKWLSYCDELTDVLLLAEDSLQLGKLLLTAAVSLMQSESFYQTAELLILAHSCFTRACNMEGISKVLKMCQKFTTVLLQNCQWSLMVRLLTGIGRYNEMRYIFQLLKDNQQFESLLSKGLDKYSGLKSATLDFVRGDKELFTLVALHFRMYSELAAMFEENAAAYLDSLEGMEDGKIIRSDHNIQTLQAAIKAFSHAAQHCVQAKKLKKATAIVNQAELTALQQSFLQRVEVGQLADCLLRLQTIKIDTLIVNTLNYEEACIVSQAYNINMDWGASLYQQFIVKNNHHYLTAWSRHHDLNNTIVQDIARRFQQEKTLTDMMVKNMKQFIQMITQTDVKYRVCSQMGFKDLLQTLLSEPCLPYLKDTVWQSGFKKQHM